MAEPIVETILLRPVGCTDCYWKIEDGLMKLPGFLAMSDDPFQVTITVKYDPERLSRLRIEAEIERLGYRLRNKKYPSPWEALRQAFSRRAS